MRKIKLGTSVIVLPGVFGREELIKGQTLNCKVTGPPQDIKGFEITVEHGKLDPDVENLIKGKSLEIRPHWGVVDAGPFGVFQGFFSLQKVAANQITVRTFGKVRRDPPRKQPKLCAKVLKEGWQFIEYLPSWANLEVNQWYRSGWTKDGKSVSVTKGSFKDVTSLLSDRADYGWYQVFRKEGVIK